MQAGDSADNHVSEVVVKSSPLESGGASQECFSAKASDPCTIVILGASGDLTSRKLMPALYNLYSNGSLPRSFAIVGCGRTEMNDEEFRSLMRQRLISEARPTPSRWGSFAAHLYYRVLNYGSFPAYEDLAVFLRVLDKKHKTRGNRIFYLALPASQYETTIDMIGRAGLSREGESGNGWVRLVVEKPFGRDLKTARRLVQTTYNSFEERQVYRIDHYLTKETVQNVLVFRFANSIFEPLWNRGYIDHVDIIAAESIGIGRRAGYYEHTGVLRDMFHDHMMQLLALIAMEPPCRFEADRVTDEKSKVFRAIRPFPLDRLKENLLLGQYTAGVVDGEKVPGYRDEPGVERDSLTPTFASMKVFIDNWRWQGVPFFITSGKRLARKLTQIAIQFKGVPHSMFRNFLGEQIHANLLTLGIHPHEKITLQFQTKNPGAKICLRSVTMDFSYHQNFQGPIPDAYEKALLDCMEGDRTLFLRQDGVELCWSFLDPVLEECETCADRGSRLLFYEAGSWGPSGMEGLGKGWRKSGNS
jgi:glucose-6-phosphate 1-dehydrogenase